MCCPRALILSRFLTRLILLMYAPTALYMYAPTALYMYAPTALYMYAPTALYMYAPTALYLCEQQSHSDSVRIYHLFLCVCVCWGASLYMYVSSGVTHIYYV